MKTEEIQEDYFGTFVLVKCKCDCHTPGSAISLHECCENGLVKNRLIRFNRDLKGNITSKTILNEQ